MDQACARDAKKWLIRRTFPLWSSTILRRTAFAGRVAAIVTSHRKAAMTLLILGVALWWAAHLFKRLAPQRRARLGDPGKGLVAVVLVLSVVLMVIGYRGADFIYVWNPPAAFTHVNNLLMILAFYLYAASGAKTWITTKIRHPQLTGFKTWAVAHLLVNGDLAAIILFGGLLAWAVVTVIILNRAAREWIPPGPAPARKEVTTVVATIVVVGVVMAIHNWLGVQPWG
jgi:uncharacterized membrane protein